MTAATSGTEQAKALELLLARLHRHSPDEIARELELNLARNARVAQLRWQLRHRAFFEQVFAMMNALERRQLCRGLGLPVGAAEESSKRACARSQWRRSDEAGRVPNGAGRLDVARGGSDDGGDAVPLSAPHRPDMEVAHANIIDSLQRLADFFDGGALGIDIQE